MKDYTDYYEAKPRSRFAENAEAASNLGCSAALAITLLMLVFAGVMSEMASLNSNKQVCIAFVQWSNCQNEQVVRDTDASRTSITTFEDEGWTWFWDDNSQNTGGINNQAAPLSAMESER